MSHPHARRGRPRLDPSGGPSAPVQVKFPAAEYAALRTAAAAGRESVQDILRRAARRELGRRAAPGRI